MQEKFDFIAIGDITTDAFIRLLLSEAHVVQKEDGKKELCMSFGDKIPYESVSVVRAVGNSPNAAVAAAKLGLRSALVTSMGDDQNGAECLATLKESSVDTRFVSIEKGKLTNYHYVLSYGAERTILIKHEEYRYILPDIGEPAWLYVSSLGEHALEFHEQILAYLTAHASVQFAFQPGTFQIKVGHEKLKGLYERAQVFFCNKEEAQRILENSADDIRILLRALRGCGPRIAVITDGPQGAYAFDGEEMWHMPMYPDPAPPVNRTGAGDAFSSTFVSALALGKSIPEALRFAPVNAMSVVQYIGAQRGLLARETLEAFLESAPPDYTANRMTQ